MPEEVTDDGYRTCAEFSAALESLSSADLQRLLAIAKIRGIATGLDGDDLFQGTLTRVLLGDRRWPRAVALTVFLANAMRSVAHSIRKEVRRERNEVEMLAYAKETVGEPACAQIEDGEYHRKLVDELFALLGDDESAQWVLLGMLEGRTAQEICEVSNIDKTAYATIRRSIRRKIDRAYPKGWKR